MKKRVFVLGRTGVGKTHIVNKLGKEGEVIFQESESNDSVTQKIQIKKNFNGDEIVDVPGYFDSNGRDIQNTCQLFDTINNSFLLCILLVFTNRIDDIVQRWLDVFKASGLDSNVILVNNKLL